MLKKILPETDHIFFNPVLKSIDPVLLLWKQLDGPDGQSRHLLTNQTEWLRGGVKSIN